MPQCPASSAPASLAAAATNTPSFPAAAPLGALIYAETPAFPGQLLIARA